MVSTSPLFSSSMTWVASVTARAQGSVIARPRATSRSISSNSLAKNALINRTTRVVGSVPSSTAARRAPTTPILPVMSFQASSLRSAPVDTAASRCAASTSTRAGLSVPAVRCRAKSAQTVMSAWLPVTFQNQARSRTSVRVAVPEPESPRYRRAASMLSRSAPNTASASSCSAVRNTGSSSRATPAK